MLIKNVMRSPEEGGAGGGGAAVADDEAKDKGGQGGGEGKGDGKPAKKVVPPEERPNITQDQLNDLIERKYTEAFEKAKGVVKGEILSGFGVESEADLKARLDGKAKKADADATQAEIEAAVRDAQKRHTEEKSSLEKQLAARDALINKLGVESALTTAAQKAGAHYPDVVVGQLQGRLRVNRETGKVEVLTESGNHGAVNSEGDPMTVDELVAQNRSRMPQLYRDSTAPGTGDKAGEGGTPEGQTIKRVDFERLSPQQKAKVARTRRIVD